jgi:phosphoribosyl-ATP pyrophosphohydrolase
MLDLKKLEEKLDNALANETSESLTNWLQEKRLKTILQTVSESTFEKMSYLPIKDSLVLESDQFQGRRK